jgi:hypothetical protein
MCCCQGKTGETHFACWRLCQELTLPATIGSPFENRKDASVSWRHEGSPAFQGREQRFNANIRRGATGEPPATIISSPGDRAGLLLSLRDM